MIREYIVIMIQKHRNRPLNHCFLEKNRGERLRKLLQGADYDCHHAWIQEQSNTFHRNLLTKSAVKLREPLQSLSRQNDNLFDEIGFGRARISNNRDLETDDLLSLTRKISQTTVPECPASSKSRRVRWWTIQDSNLWPSD